MIVSHSINEKQKKIPFEQSAQKENIECFNDLLTPCFSEENIKKSDKLHTNELDWIISRFYAHFWRCFAAREKENEVFQLPKDY